MTLRERKSTRARRGVCGAAVVVALGAAPVLPARAEGTVTSTRGVSAEDLELAQYLDMLEDMELLEKMELVSLLPALEEDEP